MDRDKVIKELGSPFPDPIMTKSESRDREGRNS